MPNQEHLYSALIELFENMQWGYLGIKGSPYSMGKLYGKRLFNLYKSR